MSANRGGSVLFLVATLFSGQAALAEQPKVSWSGFLRAAYSQSDIADPAYMGRIDKFGDFGDSHFGLNLSAVMNDKWSLAGQLFAAGREENYNMVLDWAYATYHLNSETSLSFGKIKYPGLLLSEVVDIGIVYPWVRPPDEVYNFEVLGPNISVESFSGARATYAKIAGDIEYLVEAFAGAVEVEDADLDQMLGARAGVTWGSVTAQVTHTRSRISLKGTTEREGSLDEQRQESTAAGLSVDWNNIVVYTEYVDASVNDNPEVDQTAWYATLGYRIGDFLPHITSAEFEQENKLAQESLTVGLKYTVNPSTTIKFDWQRVEPTERVDDEPTENPAGFFEEMPDESKVKLYSIALDVVF